MWDDRALLSPRMRAKKASKSRRSRNEGIPEADGYVTKRGGEGVERGLLLICGEKVLGLRVRPNVFHPIDGALACRAPKCSGAQ